MSKLLKKEDLLTKANLKTEKVELTNGHVFVREMTGKEKEQWELSMVKQKPSGEKGKPVEYETTLENFKAKLAVVTTCDDQGNLLFTDKDVDNLNKYIRASDLEKIVNVAQKLNAITQQDKDEIVKN